MRFLFLIGLAVFLIDALTKFLVVEFIPPPGVNRFWYPYGGLPVFQDFYGIDFSINYVINHGAAWGILAAYQKQLLYLRLVLIVAIFIYLFFEKKIRNQIPLVLILAGALGNIVDVFVYGHVVDMFHFVFWGFDYPVFNVADSAICIGIGWLLFNSWYKK